MDSLVPWNDQCRAWHWMGQEGVASPHPEQCGARTVSPYEDCFRSGWAFQSGRHSAWWRFRGACFVMCSQHVRNLACARLRRSRLHWSHICAVIIMSSLAGCSLLSSAAPGSPEAWVERGITQFRHATSVTITPGADGEATCDETGAGCSPFIVTQTSSTSSDCASLAACTALFRPMASQLSFGHSSVPGVLEITGKTDCTLGSWCTWVMDIDRATGNILYVDIYLGGSDHVGWPTYSLANYVEHGKVEDMAPQGPPDAKGSLSLHASGAFSLDSSSLPGTCTLDSSFPYTARFKYQSIYTDNSTGSAPLLISVTAAFDVRASRDEASVDVGVQSPGSSTIRGWKDFSGTLPLLELDGSPWHRSFEGHLPAAVRSGLQSLVVSGTFDCTLPLMDVPTPEAGPSLPPWKEGTLSAVLTGAYQLPAAAYSGACSAVSGSPRLAVTYQSDNYQPTSVAVYEMQISFMEPSLETSQVKVTVLIVQPNRAGSLFYSGSGDSAALQGDRWFRTFTAVLAPQSGTGNLQVAGEFRCG